jgi:Heterokaryon incompatibility protein (HET)
VKETRAIGLDFLWVDSYCIIQDSGEDKDKQIPHIAQIFQNSFITIVAAGVPSVHHGFLKPSSNLELMPLPVSLPDRTVRTIWLQRTFMSQDYDREPINKRAWTLQEIPLSQRLLVFPSEVRALEFKC